VKNAGLFLGLLFLAAAGQVSAATLVPELSGSFTAPCDRPFDIDDFTPLPAAVTLVASLQARATTPAPGASTAKPAPSAAAKSGGTPSASSLDQDFVQLAASLLVYDAQTETGAWAVDRFYEDFCIGDGSLVGKFPFTCTQAQRYEVVSPSRPDIAGLQRALRADLKVYLVCSAPATADSQAAWLTLAMGLDEILRGTFSPAGLGLGDGDTTTAAPAEAAVPAASTNALANAVGALAKATAKQNTPPDKPKAVTADVKLELLLQALHRTPGLIAACKASTKANSFACAMYFGSLAYDADAVMQAAKDAKQGDVPCDRLTLIHRHLRQDAKATVCSRLGIVKATISGDLPGVDSPFGDPSGHLPLDGVPYFDADTAAAAYLDAAQRAYLSGNFMAGGMGRALAAALEDLCVLQHTADATQSAACASKGYPYTTTNAANGLGDLDRLIRLHDLLQAASGGDYYDALKILAASECSTDKKNLQVGTDMGIDTSSSECRLLYVAADVVTATSTGDIETAVEQLGSTTAGWRYKEVSDGLWTLSGILGLDYERETLSGQGVSRTSYAGGLFAPIGIEYTHPTWCNNCYWGAMLSLIDVGNTVQFNSQQTVTGSNNSTGQVSTAPGLRQVWAPGVMVFMSPFRSPFVFGVGYSQTPAIRTAQFSNGSNVSLDSRRFMIYIGVDTELFPL
jgi:hypothetical protein